MGRWLSDERGPLIMPRAVSRAMIQRCLAAARADGCPAREIIPQPDGSVRIITAPDAAPIDLTPDSADPRTPEPWT